MVMHPLLLLLGVGLESWVLKLLQVVRVKLPLT
jgi:hypothetical protein